MRWQVESIGGGQSRTEPWDTPTLREKGGSKETKKEKVGEKTIKKVVCKISAEQSVSRRLTVSNTDCCKEDEDRHRFGHWLSLSLTGWKLLEILRKAFSVEWCIPLN